MQGYYTQVEKDQSVNKTDSIIQVTEPPARERNGAKIARESVVSWQTRVAEALMTFININYRLHQCIVVSTELTQSVNQKNLQLYKWSKTNPEKVSCKLANQNGRRSADFHQHGLL